MKYEALKILRQVPFKIIFLLLLTLSIVSPFLSIKNYRDDLKESFKDMTEGVDCVKVQKEKYKNAGDKLSTELLNQALSEYKKTGGETWVNIENKIPGAMLLLEKAYSPVRDLDFKHLMNLKSANDFYEKRIERIKEKISFKDDEDKYKDYEKELIIKRASELTTPLNYSFPYAYPIFFKNMEYVYMINIILALIISSSIFTMEKEKKMLSIIKALGSKKIRKVNNNKIKAVIAVNISVFVLTFIVVSLIIFSNLGMNTTAPVQLLPAHFLSFYNFSLFKMTVLSTVLSLSSMIAVIFVGCIINYNMKSSLSSLIMNAFIIFSPLFLKNIPYIPDFLRKIFQLMPINGVFLEANIDCLHIYNIFGFKLGIIESIFFVNLIIILISAVYFKLVRYGIKRNS